ncbi:MAG: hypothetical protein LBS81_02265 [Endomicrobium sp.]|nr:hypothetical protein [Endomicrobium sp.]
MYDITASEAGDDPFNLRIRFALKDESAFEKGSICSAGSISLFLSATTYAIFTKAPLKVCGFRLPDVFPYITTRGISYKVVSGYEVNKYLKLIFGFEKVFEIEPAAEYNFGIDHIIESPFTMHYRGIITFGQELDFEASCTVPLSDLFSIGIGCEIYSCKSLQG